MTVKIRVRFAPSPTGFLHVGGVRTALFNYLFAKKHSGTFILRLEDTDRERFVEAGVKQVVESLRWLGLEPDEGFWSPAEKGKHTPYVQSMRLPQYLKYAHKLLGQGLAYYSPTSSQKLDELRQLAKHKQNAFLYRRGLDKANSNTHMADTPIRLDVEAAIKQVGGKRLEWVDLVRGKFAENLELLEDFILIKADGFPTYNFANVIDDHVMEITHTIRGDEFISSTIKHHLLHHLFGWASPAWAHLPVINGTDGKKLSKRTGDTDVLEYRNKGYLPEALLNFLALLGWNDGSQQEIFTLDQLIEKFGLERVQKSPAVFDPKRLDWMNGLYIRQLSFEELLQRSEGFWPAAARSFDLDYKKRVLRVVQERLERFDQLPELTTYFFEPPEPNLKVMNELEHLFKKEKHSLRTWLQSVIKVIHSESTAVSEPSGLEKPLRAAAVEAGGKPAALFGSLRVALTQADQTPPIWEIIYVLGKEETIKRIEATTKML